MVPKEMLPIGARPAIALVIDECLAAGANPVYVVTRPGDLVVPRFVEHLRGDGLPVHAVVEDLACGYGNAAGLLTLRDQLADSDTFLVAFGDEVLLGDPPGADLVAMRHRAQQTEAMVVAAQRVNRAEIASFGVVDLAVSGGDRIVGIRQRPAPATVTEPSAVVSRLVLRASILDQLTPTDRAGGEVDLGIAVGDAARVSDVRVHQITAYWGTVGEPRRYFDLLARHWLAPAPNRYRPATG
jgi:UTP--glucose-1-phosphate uridylyltransferase